MQKISRFLVAALLAAGVSGFCEETILKDDFSTNAAGAGIPAGWRVYKLTPDTGRIAVEEKDGKKVLHITDLSDQAETGITRQVTVKKGKYYKLSCTVNYAAGAKDKPSLQLRFNSKPKDAVFNTQMQNGKTTSVTGKAIGSNAQLYVWTGKNQKPDFFVKEVVLEVSDNPFNK